MVRNWGWLCPFWGCVGGLVNFLHHPPPDFVKGVHFFSHSKKEDNLGHRHPTALFPNSPACDRPVSTPFLTLHDARLFCFPPFRLGLSKNVLKNRNTGDFLQVVSPLHFCCLGGFFSSRKEGPIPTFYIDAIQSGLGLGSPNPNPNLVPKMHYMIHFILFFDKLVLS